MKNVRKSYSTNDKTMFKSCDFSHSDNHISYSMTTNEVKKYSYDKNLWVSLVLFNNTINF